MALKYKKEAIHWAHFSLKGLMKFYLFCIVTFAILGCATPTPYQEATSFGMGYKDQKLDGEKYRVSFKGNRITERETVETYLIFRAAEITLKEGFDYFTMIQWNTDRYSQVESISPVVYGYYGQNTQIFPYYVYGSPPMVRGGTMENVEYEAVAFINMAKVPPQDKKENYYKASEIIKNLNPKIQKNTK